MGQKEKLLEKLRGKPRDFTFEEAELSILCKKIYFQDLDIEKIPAELVDHYYQSEAPHRMFVGEVIEIREK